MKKVVITGATGFIGKALTKELLNNGVDVTAIAFDPEKLDDIACDKLKTVNASFDDYRTLGEKMGEDEYDCMFHLAWGGYGKATNDYTVQITNAIATCDAVTLAKQIGCKRFVFSTSFSEYMIPVDSERSHNENGVCNVYGATKESARILAQAVAKQIGIDMLSVAFSNTFGPGDYSKRTPNLFITKFQNHQPVDLTEGVDLYEWTYIDDTVDGLIAAASKGKPGEVYYIGSNNVRPLIDIVTDIRDVIYPEGEINIGKYHEVFKCDYSSIDTFKLYRDTGFQSKCDFKESVLKLADWLKEIDFKI